MVPNLAGLGCPLKDNSEAALNWKISKKKFLAESAAMPGRALVMFREQISGDVQRVVSIRDRVRREPQGSPVVRRSRAR
jgi:hypothetical protein